MQVIQIKGGCRFEMAGEPTEHLTPVATPERLAVLPDRWAYVKPRLHVARGDRVKRGTPLFFDKRHRAVQFCSPGGGIVESINWGPRRTIREIIIRLDENEPEVSFDPLDLHNASGVTRERIVRQLLEGGLWPLLRALPFRDMPAPKDPAPAAILVTLDNRQPFTADPALYLKGHTERFLQGLEVLGRLSGGAVHVTAPESLSLDPEIAACVTHRTKGRYPAGDAGVVVYHMKRSVRENGTWYIDGQHLLWLADLLVRGRYPRHCTVAVGGSGISDPRHVRCRLGSPLRALTGGASDAMRLVAGGLMTGYHVPANSYLGMLESAITVVPEGRTREFLPLFNPGWHKPTFSRAYVSGWLQRPLVYDCNRHGGRRACIGCMHCADVCPVGILPQFAYKAVLAEEVEETLAHGLLDCVECGLCAYVCPAKIELTQVLQTARREYYKER